jgi:hypothetical protein
VIPAIATAKAAFAAGKVWFLLGAALVLFGIGMAAGIKWENGETQEALRERDSAIVQRDNWKSATASLQRAVNLWEQRAAADKHAQQEARKQADKVLKDLAKKKAQAERDEAEWRKRYAAAVKSPDCAELLKVTKCAAFRSY